MKKLMIAAAIVCAAAFAQAASFNWGGQCLSSSANVEYPGYANVGTVYRIYELSGLVTSDLIKGYDKNTGAILFDASTEVTAKLLQTHVLDATEWDNGEFGGGTIKGESASALDKTYVIAMYDASADADLFSAEVYTVKDMSDTQPGAIEIHADAKSGKYLGQSLHSEVVPEPTSGLLLLLGVAGLALRRRRA